MLRPHAPVPRAPRRRGARRATRKRRGHRAEPSAAPDTAIGLGTHRSSGDGGAGELIVRPRAETHGGGRDVDRVASPPSQVAGPTRAHPRGASGSV
ncbi:hypothetical protein C1280_11675 [Gemmata obscuriglobus]|uniref:Uncharacterized protein n=1 Tax=Gemmata obscuriglobus TaxID=114 RepID=A0A2Z3H1J3_9BACT|nr:hypothetical protein C1280_11675 [Gemmata obscuriglobus]